MLEIGRENPVVVAMAIGVVSFTFVWFYMREADLPGTVKKAGIFEVEDVDDASKMEERRRDFLRCARALKGIYTCVDGDIKQLYTKELEAEDAAIKVLSDWLASNKIKIDTSKVIPLLSITPGFAFLMRFNIPPTTKGDKYTLVAGDGGVRLLWSSFITDAPKPDQIAGPFILHMLSEDLVTKDPKSSVTRYTYSVKPNSATDMLKILESKCTTLAKIGSETSLPASAI